MDFDQTCPTICCDMKKNWLDFGDLDSIFKVTGGLRLLENGFSAPYLQNEWLDFDETSTAILLRQGQELIRFGWPLSHFQGYRETQIVGKCLFCTLSLEWMGGFDQTSTAILLRQGQELYNYIVVHGKELIRFWWPWLHFQGHRRAQIVGKWLFCTLSPEWMAGFWRN